MLTEAEAVKIAKGAIRGKVEVQSGAPIKIALQGNTYIIVFVHINPPGTVGPDFDAQVSVNAVSGTAKILRVGS